ncbi:MAG: TonB family protein [Flavobacteriales bacterium]|nr:TonB family protein [Flavobacteriales bacterium]
MTTALILLLVVVLFSLLLSDLGWSNVLSSSRNDVVFADRNRRYGAYRIRQEHHRVMIVSFLSASGIVAAGFAIPMLLSAGNFVAPPTIIPPHIPDGVIIDIGKVYPPQPPTPIKTEVIPPVKDPAKEPEIVVAIDSLPAQPELKVDSSLTVSGPAPDKGGISSGPGGVPPTTGGGGGQVNSGSGGSDTHLKHIWQLDVHPEFPGGQKGLTKFFEREVHYPGVSEELGHEGTVWVEFVVDVDGSVTRVRLAKGVKKELDAEALRVVRSMPRWKPGMIDDQPVPVLHQQKIVFEIGK